MKRIKEKIKDIKEYIVELEEIVPVDFDEYAKSNLVKAACERYVERIIEGLTDVAFLVIKYKRFDLPEDDIDAFRILSDKKVISESLYNKLRLAKGMRNIIAHEYGRIEDEIVFESISDELVKDATLFLNTIKKFIK